MERKYSLNNVRLLDIAYHCNELLKSSENMHEAMNSIALYISSELGDFFSPGILRDPNEVSIHFIELLDQIIFEVQDNLPAQENVRDYIIEDLYMRLTIYIEAFMDIEDYKRKLFRRLVIRDDAFIIQKHGLYDCVDYLIASYHEQPSIQLPVLKACRYFTSENIDQFLSKIILAETDVEKKITALTGLLRNSKRPINLDQLSKDFNLDTKFFVYIKNFQTKNISKNDIPEDIYSLLFVLNYLEADIKSIKETADYHWIARVIKRLSEVTIDGSLSQNMYGTISNIVLFMDLRLLDKILRDQENLLALMKLIDIMPGELFQRMAIRLDMIYNDISHRARQIISLQKYQNTDENSNSLSYFLWDERQPL